MAKDTPRIVCNHDNSDARLLAENNQVIAAIGSTAWFEWLENNRAFTFEPQSSDMELLWNYGVQKEKRKDGFYWIAYKRFKGKLERIHLGVSQELKLEKLLDASKKFPTKFHSNSIVVLQQPDDDPDPDPDIDVPVDPSEDEVIRSQATKIQSLQAEVCLLKKEKAELRSQLAETAQLAESFDLLQVQVAALALEDAHLREQVEELQTLKEEHNQTQSQLDNQARLAGKWHEKAKALEVELEQLRFQSVKPAVDSQVIEQFAGLVAKINKKGTGYSKNSFSQGLETLRGILRLLGLEITVTFESDKKQVSHSAIK